MTIAPHRPTGPPAHRPTGLIFDRPALSGSARQVVMR